MKVVSKGYSMAALTAASKADCLVFQSAATMVSSTADKLDESLVAGKAALTAYRRVDSLVQLMAVQKAVHLDQTKAGYSAVKLAV